MGENNDNIFPALVVEVLNEYEVVINRGSSHGIKTGQRFLVFELSEKEIYDPETEKSLGFLEIVKGTGKITHVQDKMATIRSDMLEYEKSIIKRKSGLFPFGSEEENISSPELQPFEEPKRLDKAKPVS